MNTRTNALLTLAAGALGAAVLILPVLARGEFVYPVDGDVLALQYGAKGSIDIDVAGGTNIMAARSGKVTSYGDDGRGGSVMVIDHGHGYESLYDSPNATFWLTGRGAGEDVGAGNTILTTQQQGDSTIHFEIRRYGVVQYVPGKAGDALGAGVPIAKTFKGLKPDTAPVLAWVANQTVTVWDSQGGASLGKLESGHKIASHGQSRDAKWLLVDFRGQTGWVRATAVDRVTNVGITVLIHVISSSASAHDGNGGPAAGALQNGGYYVTLDYADEGNWQIDWGNHQEKWVSVPDVEQFNI